LFIVIILQNTYISKLHVQNADIFSVKNVGTYSIFTILLKGLKDSYKISHYLAHIMSIVT